MMPLPFTKKSAKNWALFHESKKKNTFKGGKLFGSVFLWAKTKCIRTEKTESQKEVSKHARNEMLEV